MKIPISFLGDVKICDCGATLVTPPSSEALQELEAAPSKPGAPVFKIDLDSEFGVTVAHTTNRMDAEDAVQRLATADISAWLVNDEDFPEVARRGDGAIRVQVIKSSAPQAHVVLYPELQTEVADNVCIVCRAPMEESEERCRSCGWSYM
jgi:hypothetical protein